MSCLGGGERAHEQEAAEHSRVAVLAVAQPDAHFHEVVLAAGVPHARQRVGLHIKARVKALLDELSRPATNRATHTG